VDSFFTVRHLPPGTTHTFTVKARDEAGNLYEASSPVTVTLLPSTDTVGPAAPTNLTGSTWPSCGFLDLSWSHPGDRSGELEYEIHEDGLFRGVYRWEAFEGSFGLHAYFIRAVNLARTPKAPECPGRSRALCAGRWGSGTEPVDQRPPPQYETRYLAQSSRPLRGPPRRQAPSPPSHPPAGRSAPSCYPASVRSTNRIRFARY